MAAVMLAAILSSHHRWTLFIPNAEMIVARVVIGAAVAFAFIAVMAVLSHRRKGSEKFFSRISLLVIVLGCLMGFFSASAATGASALFNGMHASTERVCFQLDQAGGSLVKLHEPEADGTAPTDTLTGRPRELRFRGMINFSGVDVGDRFELALKRGTFGYTLERGQAPTPGCARP